MRTAGPCRYGYSALFDSLPYSAAIVNAAGIITAVNDSWIRFAAENGYGHPECGLQINYLDICDHAEDCREASAAAAAIRAVLSGRTFASAAYACNSPKAQRRCEAIVTPLRDGEEQGALTIHMDVSHIALRLEEARGLCEDLSLMVDQISGLGLILLDENGRIRRWTGAAESMYGYTPAEAEGATLGLIFTPEDVRWGLPRRHLDEAAAQGSALDERWFRRRNGTQFYGVHSLQCLRHPDGRIRGFLSLVSGWREVRRTGTAENLQVLAGGFAHRINNLLTGIVGYASLMKETLESGHEAHDHIARLLQLAEEAGDLTAALVAYAGLGRYRLERIALNEIVSATVAELAARKPPRIAIFTELQEDLPPVEGTRSQLCRIVRNLIINAWEAIGTDQDGEVDIATSLKLVGPESALEPGAYDCLKVSDSGEGMDTNTQRRVFDPFFTTKFLGRGLGLSEVAGIARGHSGAVMVTSTPGAGSTFEVLIPAIME